MMQTRLPSIRQIIRIDYLAISLAGVPVAMWVLLAVVYIMPAWLNNQPVELNAFSILVLIAATLYCWLALAWRVNKIRSVFAAGVHVKGVITKIWFFRNRGQMYFNYTYLGAQHDAKMTLVKNETTSALTEGAELDLLVDPDDPKRTFLQNLFI